MSHQHPGTAHPQHPQHSMRHHAEMQSGGYQPWSHHQAPPPHPSAGPPVPSSHHQGSLTLLTTSSPQHQTSLGSKRSSVMSDSDCEDVFSEESSSKEQCGSPGNGDPCQLMTRKRRRGIIEKRRRDRINNSLSELRRLVPSAFEKQGSAKLEKAEILQLTVEHLRLVHNKGMDALAYEPHKLAMDYHGLGFRECAAEVARYLVTVEGMDVQDPLRLRLMSHLQCFAAQREMATKQAAAAASVWPGTPSAFTQSPYTPSATSNTGASPAALPPPPPSLAPTSSSASGGLEPIHYGESSPPTSQATSVGSAHYSQYTSTVTSASSSSFQGLGSSPFSPSGGQMKPYRPWGAEVAY